jgi:hypothetical protein
MRQLGIVLLAVTTGFAGCASVSVQRAKDVSAAGVAYAQATQGVIDVAIDASIDASSQSKLLGKPRTPVTDAARQSAREIELKQVDDELIASSVSYVRLKRSVNAIEAYFKALQQLADGSPADATESAVKALADRLNGLNNALDKKSDGTPLVSDEQKGAIAGLSKLVAAQVHGAIVARNLERDAPVIGRTLVLQEMVLKAAEDDIRANLTNAAARFYTSKVVGPYRTGAIDDTWVDDRRAYLKVKALGNTPEALTSAQAAAKQMQTVWARILSGEYSAQELTAMLKDTEDLLAAVAALKEANAKK